MGGDTLQYRKALAMVERLWVSCYEQQTTDHETGQLILSTEHEGTGGKASQIHARIHSPIQESNLYIALGHAEVMLM